MANQDAIEAIVDVKEALAEYGESVGLIKKGTEAVYDEWGDTIITPAQPDTETTIDGIPKDIATDKILARLTDTQKESYSLYMLIYTTEEINKVDYLINFQNEKYEIVELFTKRLQATDIIQELLLKKG